MTYGDSSELINKIPRQPTRGRPLAEITTSKLTISPEILDPALLRPGRFDRQVLVGRLQIVQGEELKKLLDKAPAE
jgi:SpoVK/Ycf46/Vps4 family AAA+-type ATPase